jgi:Uma2 family endonuclease
MPSSLVTPVELVTGQRMDAEEFLRRWEKLPELKNAELIEGVVYVSSPLSREHGHRDTRILWWLTQSADATPGCDFGNNSTWRMLDSAPQPDAYLRISSARGGQSGDAGQYCSGAPELVVEICLTSADVDLGPKLRLYEKAGVREYITVESAEKRIVWRVLENGVYRPQELPADGIFCSRVFPGLWLDVAAFWADDGPRMLAALNAGLATEDHQRFVASLAGTSQGGKN